MKIKFAIDQKFSWSNLIFPIWFFKNQVQTDRVINLFVPRAYLNICRCESAQRMSIHVVVRQQNDFDGRDSWCESTLTRDQKDWIAEGAKRRWWRRMLEAVFWPRVAQWFRLAKTRWKFNSPKVISRVFPTKFLQIYITSVSTFQPLYALHTYSETCQIIASTSMIRQFHEFFQSNFWRVFDVWLIILSEAVFLASARIGSSWRYVSQCFLSMMLWSLVTSLFAPKMNERLVKAPLAKDPIVFLETNKNTALVR